MLHKQKHAQEDVTMAIIYEQSLFSWNDLESLGDLERLKLVIDNLPDDDLMFALWKKRKNGRKDYPIPVVWNSILAGVVFQHSSIESLRRELLRNAQLRQLCGFDIVLGADAVPSSSAYSRFLKTLFAHTTLIDGMFQQLVLLLKDILPDFCKELALDSKAIQSHASPRKKEDASSLLQDGRRELDADFGAKTYRGKNEDGSIWEKVKTWFGFKLHLLVDANYELPVGYSVSRASAHDAPEGHKLIDAVAMDQPSVLVGCKNLMADKGYDDGKFIEKLWDDHAIKPIIDIRNLWKDDPTRLLPGTTNVTYDYRGTIQCHCPKTGEVRKMAFSGFERDRASLKYTCPVVAYGASCLGCVNCPVKHSIRVPMYTDRRIFTPVARSSYKWQDLYNKRTAVERVNSRLDVSFGFEVHYIRGLKKMKFRCGLALCVMLAIALGRARQNQTELIRSLVRTPSAA